MSNMSCLVYLNAVEFYLNLLVFRRSICGLPFKLLDKKSEKQLLFARKKELQAQLQNATSAKDIIELSIMLLFQQVKGMAICGDKLTSAILGVLTSNKKMPISVSELLRKGALLLENGTTVPDEILDAVKSCALSRDLASYEALNEMSIKNI